MHLGAAVLGAPADDIDSMSMSERRALLRAFNLRGEEFGVVGAWRRLEGVTEFFDGAGLGPPGSWLSRVNAVVLEAVERGLAVASDPGADDYGNPGARAWASYLRLFAAGAAEPHAATLAWSSARRVSVEHAKRWAKDHGVEPTAVETRFLMIADLCNLALCHRPVVDFAITYAGALGPSLAGIDPTIIDRLFDPHDSEATRRGCEIAYAAALIEPRATCGQQEHRLAPVIRAMLEMLGAHQ